MTTRLFEMPFAERMELVSRWSSTQEIAYQVAWAHMRGESPPDYVCPESESLRGLRLDNVRRMTRLILTQPDNPIDEQYRAMAEMFDVCGPLMTETQKVLMIRAVYRKEFIRNPDPHKEAWFAFVETVHEGMDPHGRTSRKGLGFKTRDWTLEGAQAALLLNRLFAKANKIWDYGAPEEGDRMWADILAETTPVEVLEHARTAKLYLSQADDTAALTDERLADRIEEFMHECPHCRSLLFSKVEAKRLYEVVQERAWDEEERREYECD